MKMNDFSPRLLIVMDGDIHNDPEMTIKYQPFINALGRRFPIAGVRDAGLHGLQRVLNAARVWHPDLKKWKARTVKNIPAFIARSKNAADWVRSMQGRADVVIQLGVMFDPGAAGIHLPKLIYSDYTARLSAARPDAGRSPLTGDDLQRWFELEGKSLRQAAHVCVRSQLVRDSLVDDYGIAHDQVCVIGGGVNMEELPEPGSGTENEDPVILFIGLDFYRKGGDLVLRAFASARAAVPNARLVVVTRSALPPGMPLEGVTLLPPVWEREEFLQLYRQADIFVLPSRLETWGDVLLEAMSYGLPCIGVTGQPMAEIIRDGGTGLLVPPEDAAALAEAFGKLLKDRSLRTQMGLAGRTLVGNEFTWEKVVDRLAPVIVEAAGIKNPSR